MGKVSASSELNHLVMKRCSGTGCINSVAVQRICICIGRVFIPERSGIVLIAMSRESVGWRPFTIIAPAIGRSIISKTLGCFSINSSNLGKIP